MCQTVIPEGLYALEFELKQSQAHPDLAGDTWLHMGLPREDLGYVQPRDSNGSSSRNETNHTSSSMSRSDGSSSSSNETLHEAVACAVEVLSLVTFTGRRRED